MAKADLHVHSKYSDYASTWLLKAYDSPESFTEPQMLYEQAKSRGMNLVTITDHDDIRGCLELTAAHPSDTFISCEVTTYFPIDNCKIHILVYDIDEQQFDHIMAIRRNIFIFRDYLVEQNIAHSVAHATYDQDGKLTFEHIEQLVLMFDVFEIVNGGSDCQNNQLLHKYLLALDAQTLDELYDKHGIAPISDDPWVKGFTGGSDDHCGILIGTAFTQNDATTVEEFVQQIRDKKSLGYGMHGTFASYATGVFKHIHDYRGARDPKYKKTKMNDFLEMFFVGDKGNWVKRFKKSHSMRHLKRKNSRTHKALHKLLGEVSDGSEKDIANKIPAVYQNITELHDEMFHSVITALTKHIPSGDIFKGFNRLATLFPMTLLATPFVGSMRHQVLKADLKRDLILGTKQHYTEKALWFTDTIDDLNGVSVTLHQIAKHSVRHRYQLQLVTCIDDKTLNTPLPANTINFEPIKQITIPGYEQQTICFPSLLTVMQRVIIEQPDQLIISTPGPLGMSAVLCGKLMDLPVKAIYHTDFAEQLLRMTGEATLANVTDHLVTLFYKMADRVFVPSQSYIDKLKQNGLKPDALEIFPRGLDLDLYCPSSTSSDLLRRHQMHGGFTLLFAGRISEDKNLSLLVKIFTQLNVSKPGLYNLVIAGDGPDINSLKESLTGEGNVHFTGRVQPDDLVECYRCADLLVFPSHTDTFGMVVLEAQACGVPCLVTNNGGPKEIIHKEVTGYVVETDLSDDWIKMIEHYQNIKINKPEEFSKLKTLCAEHVHQQNNWQPVFDAVLGNACKIPDSDTDSASRNTLNTKSPHDLAA